MLRKLGLMLLEFLLDRLIRPKVSEYVSRSDNEYDDIAAANLLNLLDELLEEARRA